MGKWWMCICKDVSTQKLTTRSFSVPESPTKPLPANNDLLLFKVDDLQQLQELLDEIEKTLSRVRQRTRRMDLISKNVVQNIQDASHLLDILGQACQNSTGQLQNGRYTDEVYSILYKFLKGAGNLHWAGAALSILAFILNRMDEVSSNYSDCLFLLIAIKDFAKHLVTLIPQLPEENEKLHRATCLVTEGVFLCCSQMNTGFWTRFSKSTSIKDKLNSLQKELVMLYPDLTLTVSEATLGQTALLLRQTSVPLSPFKPEYPTNKVGLDERVEAVVRILRLREQAVRAVVLHGMGGIGKSTLGMAVHACVPFGGRKDCKIEVGECPTAEKIRDLQQDILERLMGRKQRFGDCSEGRQKLGAYFESQCKEAIFIYVDNVFHGEDLDRLLPDRLSLPVGSRIIVTTRDVNVCAVLKFKGVTCEPYPVAELEDEEARRLLCMQVFDDSLIPPNREQQVKDLLCICGGLPLALEVVGKYLKFHNRDSAWTQAIDCLKTWNPLSGTKENQLFHSLQFSYDQLADHTKETFLDVTSFFRDLPWEMVEHIYGERLIMLEDLALVKRLNDDGIVRLQVHDLLVALGRRLQQGTRVSADGTKELPSILKEDDWGSLKRLEGLSLRNCSEPLLAEKLDIMNKCLRILILDHVEVLGKCLKIPERLQLLITRSVMPYKRLGKLRELAVLIMCETLVDYRDLEFPRELKALYLVECETLEELPCSIGELRSLHTLSMSGCENLKRLPANFGQLSCLHTLDLSGCSSLKDLPEGFGQLRSLQILKLVYCKQLKELPKGFGQLGVLQELNLGGCESFNKLPDDFGNLCSLQALHLWQCESLDVLPSGFAQLSCLRELYLTGCERLQNLSEGFERLVSLQILALGNCQALTTLPPHIGQLSLLETLKLSDCFSLKDLPESFSNLSRLRWLDISGSSISNMHLVQHLQQHGCHVVNDSVAFVSTDYSDSTEYEYEVLMMS